MYVINDLFIKSIYLTNTNRYSQQIGIATAFLVGGTMATSVMGLGQYLTLTTVICAAITIGTILQFQEKPPSPPSTSEIDKMKIGEEEEPPFFESVKSLFATDGFSMPVIAFICSISITNIVGVSDLVNE